jgi:hypothetical protein
LHYSNQHSRQFKRHSGVVAIDFIVIVHIVSKSRHLLPFDFTDKFSLDAILNQERFVLSPTRMGYIASKHYIVHNGCAIGIVGFSSDYPCGHQGLKKN